MGKGDIQWDMLHMLQLVTQHSDLLSTLHNAINQTAVTVIVYNNSNATQ